MNWAAPWARSDLGLYRKRSGEESFVSTRVMSAGAFSIQRLEGSRGGILVLGVLNGREEREGWGIRESIRGRRGQWSSREDFPKVRSVTTGAVGARVVVVFGQALESY